jgi:hypothetical protein
MGKGGQKTPRGVRERIIETEDRRVGGWGRGKSREFFFVGRFKGHLLFAAHCPDAS